MVHYIVYKWYTDIQTLAYKLVILSKFSYFFSNWCLIMFYVFFLHQVIWISRVYVMLVYMLLGLHIYISIYVRIIFNILCFYNICLVCMLIFNFDCKFAMIYYCMLIFKYDKLNNSCYILFITYFLVNLIMTLHIPFQEFK